MAALATIVFSSVLSDERTMQLLWTSLCLVAALLVAAVVIACVNRWRRQRDTQEDLSSPNAQLAHFRSLYEKGAISKEEFERLRALLAARMRESLGVRPTGETPVPLNSRGELPQTGETPVPPNSVGTLPKTGETPVPPDSVGPASRRSDEMPETGIQRPDGPDKGIHPA
jgi:hypothetical protein